MEKKTFRDSALRAIAVIGLVAILLLGAWGIIQIAFVLPSFFANVFGPKVPPTTLEQPQESIAVVAPPSITSGQTFTLEWNHAATADTQYSYQISYSCADGLMLHAPVPAGNYESVPCNTSFNFTNADKTVQLTALLSNKAPVSTTFTVFATRLSDGIVTAVGSTTLQVLPAVSVHTATTTPPVVPLKKTTPTTSTRSTPASTYVAAPRASTLYGAPDLAVAISSVQPVGARYSMQFVVTNVGTNVSAAGWTLTASLPLNPVYTYVSGPQMGLYPGDKIVYTLTFDAPSTYAQPTYGTNCSYPYTGYNCDPYNTYSPYTNSGNRTVSIMIDPQNVTVEYNKANNTATTQI